MPEPTDGARMTMVDQNLLARISHRMRMWITGRRPPELAQEVTQDARMLADPRAADPAMQVPTPNPYQPAPANGFMTPGQPMTPMAPAEDVAGRRFDYPATYNINIAPRRYEGVTFESLRALADGYNLLRLAIETRKDQMAKMVFSVMPRLPPGEVVRKKADERCAQVEDFFRKPDRRSTWDSWVRQVTEEVLVTDSVSIYRRRTMDGQLYAAELIDGATIRPLIDIYGRQPSSPLPAYQQIIKGMPVIDYTSDELLYLPRNKRVNKMYGYSPVEQVIMTVNIAIRREVAKLGIYTEGNVPEALVSTPREWGPDQIQRFQTYFDNMMKDQRERRRMKFVPGDMHYQPTRSDNIMMEQADEWLARVICYAFSLPPLPFVKVQNRATADTALETALEEGLLPLLQYMKAMLDHIVQAWFGYDDLEIVWDDVRKVDPAEQEKRNLDLMVRGLKSIDEIRAEMGKDPLGVPHLIFGIGPMGVMSVASLKKALAQGMDLPQMAPPPDAYGGMAASFGGGPGFGGFPSPGGPPSPPIHGLAPDAVDVLSGLSPAVLDALGMNGKDPGEEMDTPADQLIRDAVNSGAPPAGLKTAVNNVLVHPALRQLIRTTESRLGRAR